MFCPDCGHELSSDTARFCFKCGNAMPTAGSASAPAPAYAQQGAGAYAPQATLTAQQPLGQQPFGQPMAFPQGVEPLGAPKKSKAGVAIAIVVGLIAAAGAFFAVRTFTGGSASLDGFASGDGVTFSEPSGKFSVAMPKDPAERRQTTPLPDGTSIETVLYYVDNEPEYVFLAGYTDVGARPFDLNAGAQGAAGMVGGTVTSQTPRTVGGIAGQEVHMSVAGTSATMWLGVSGGTLYQLQAIGIPDGHAGITRFFDSFQPGGSR